MKEKKEKVDYRKIIEKVKPIMEKAAKEFEEDLKTLRASRASFGLIEDLLVDCFGQRFPLRQLAQISIPEPRQIVISPWDSSYVEPIIKSIEKSGIGLSPIVDGTSIKINLPPITEEFKKNLLKVLSQKKEVAKKKIREARTKAWDELQHFSRLGKISEDQKYKGKDELQDLVEDFNEKIEEMSKRKEREILG